MSVKSHGKVLYDSGSPLALEFPELLRATTGVGADRSLVFYTRYTYSIVDVSPVEWITQQRRARSVLVPSWAIQDV